MTTDQHLDTLAQQIGVLPAFTDMQGQVHQTTPDTQRAFLRANGLAVDTPKEIAATLSDLQQEKAQAYIQDDVILRRGQSAQIAIQSPVEYHVLQEQEQKVIANGRGDDFINLGSLPCGVHTLVLTGKNGEQSVNLIVAPHRSPALPEISGATKTWGVMAALYGLYGRGHPQLGNYADLGDMAAELGQQGAGFLGINPIHALGWAAEETISPYSPTHRGFLNTAHIALSNRAEVGRNQTGAYLDYDAHQVAHRAALKQQYLDFQDHCTSHEKKSFKDYCHAGGHALAAFAAFEKLSDTHGSDWRQWPRDLQELSAQKTAEISQNAGFHKWLQWQADEQVGRAQQKALDNGMGLGLYLDLAVGARLGGAESWGADAATAVGVSLGAPPDHLSPAGQNWQLAALSPHKLKTNRYEVLHHILAQNLRHCGILRIDHALGLNRSYWIPEDGSPGGYIKQPFEALLAIVAIEAERAQSVIVGEDLGLVPAGFRDQLEQAGLYGYTVLQYEKDSSGQFLDNTRLRAQSLACFGTHDTPTLRGYWEGCDIDWWRKLDWIDDDQERKARKTRLDEKRQWCYGEITSLPKDASAMMVRDAIHRRLAASPAVFVAAQLDDVLCQADAQNLPGTVDEHPNWRRRYPKSIEDIARSPDLAQTAELMNEAGRGKPTEKSRKDSK